jgi:hypothetical protein
MGPDEADNARVVVSVEQAQAEFDALIDLALLGREVLIESDSGNFVRLVGLGASTSGWSKTASANP